MSQTIVHDLRATLSDQEKEIYGLLCQNLTNVQISEQINMPEPTVCWHLRNIYKKLGVASRSGNERLSVRQRAMLYGGTRIEQVVSYSSDKGSQVFSVSDIQRAAKKTGISVETIENLISFLEMGG